MSWQPLLEGGLKAQAMESIAVILEALSTRERDLESSPSLAGGTAGLAVLHGYLAQAGGGQDHAALAAELLQRATAAVADDPGSASLYGGLAGVGWALAHFQGRLPRLDAEDELAEIDEALLEHLDQSPWPETYDLIDGLAGFGVYALERGTRPGAVACLERVIDRLAETAEHREDGITWESRQEWLPEKYQHLYPHRYYNLGLAHGVPGVVALLGQACAAGVAVGKARPLLDGTVRWLLAQQTPEGFPSGVEKDQAKQPARLAWCYGDPGVAASLLWAARLVNEPTWEREALAIAVRAAGRPVDKSGVVDAGLCHGAAGLGHLFNRMCQVTREECLAQAARFWFEQTLKMPRPGKGVGGYEAWQLDDDQKVTWIADPGLLTGASGIALALLAATTDMEPAWDRMLLVAIPPRAARSLEPVSAL
jgi:lantibiotic modifying enzyme